LYQKNLRKNCKFFSNGMKDCSYNIAIIYKLLAYQTNKVPRHSAF
jgi:hypothetical protein